MELGRSLIVLVGENLLDVGGCLRTGRTIEKKYKARLVAKGYTQKQDEDFLNTYSHVARLSTIQVLVSLAFSYSLHVRQLDVKTAFLNG
jgi:hypothetical protein